MTGHRAGRAVGLGVIALVLMAVMVLLGYWQLQVYRDRRHADSAASLNRPPVPLDSVLGPDSAFPADATSRPVTVTGRYLPAEQVYVRGLPGATSRYAVVTPLLTSNGSAVLVVRGGRAEPGSTPPPGPVRVVGVLEPSDASGALSGPNRVTRGLDVAALVNSVPHDLYGGYLLLRSSDPPSNAGLASVRPPLPAASTWAGIRNLAYACQWLVFAGFVAFMWWRMVRERPEDEPAEDADLGPMAMPVTDQAVERLR